MSSFKKIPADIAAGSVQKEQTTNKQEMKNYDSKILKAIDEMNNKIDMAKTGVVMEKLSVRRPP